MSKRDYREVMNKICDDSGCSASALTDKQVEELYYNITVLVLAYMGGCDGNGFIKVNGKTVITYNI